MAKKEIILTREGIVELEKKLEILKTVRRQEVAEQIKSARTFGDISENAEYDEAKNEQARIEGEIAYIERTLRMARVVEDISTEIVGVGNTVRVRFLDNNEEYEYTIVGSTEANPATFKISNESPIGKALLGRRIGEVVDIAAPGGSVSLAVLDICN